MNRDVIQSIGEFVPPLGGDNMILKSIAVNIWGDLFFICEGGEIRYVSLKKEGSDGSSLPRTLSLDSSNAFVDAEYSNIEFNNSGSILLLAGTYFAGVVLLPRAYSFDGSQSLYSGDVECKRKDLFFCPEGESIIKIQWHPFSEKHVVILLDSAKLLLIDVVDAQQQEFTLDASVRYKSFCFGPSTDWLRLTVFLLHADGDVSYLCPILPMAAAVPARGVSELRAWQQDEAAFAYDATPGMSDSAEKLLDAYLEMTSLYLRAAFGYEGDGRTGDTAISYSDSHPVRAGVQKGGVCLSSGSKLFAAFYRTPVVQGPLEVEGRLVSASKARGRDAAEACDICVPVRKDGECAVPLLLVVWSNGDIEQLLIGDSVRPVWDMRGVAAHTPEATPLVHMETIAISLTAEGDCTDDDPSGSGDSSTVSRSLARTVPSDLFYFVPDPVSQCHFHVVGPSSGKSYLVTIPWLALEDMSADAMDGVEAPGGTGAIIVYDKPRKIRTAAASRAEMGDGLAGMVVIEDPTLGHIAVFRSTDGFVSAVNLTVQLKLVELERHLKVRNEDSDELRQATAKADTSALLEHKEYSLKWIASKLITRAQKGIDTVPRMHRRDQANMAECMDALARAKEHLEENTLLPLEQLLQRTQFTEGIIRDVYECQTEILQGNGEGDIGYALRLKMILEQQDKLRGRIDAVGETLQRQKNLAASALSVSLSTQAKISHAEKVYATQLRSWNAVQDRLAAAIASLQQRKEFVRVVSSPGMTPPRPAGSTRWSKESLGATGGRPTPSTRRDIRQRGTPSSSSSPYFASPRRRPVGGRSNGNHESPGFSDRDGRDDYQQKRRELRGSSLIFLTDEEVEACTQLLSAEQDMLKVTDRATVSLEERLHSLAQNM